MMMLAKERAVKQDLVELIKKHGYDAVVHGVEVLDDCYD